MTLDKYNVLEGREKEGVEHMRLDIHLQSLQRGTVQGKMLVSSIIQ